MPDRLITSAQNVVPVHTRPQSLSPLADSRVNDSLAADHPTLQRGAASARRRYLHDIYMHAAARIPRSCSRRGSDLDCLATRGQDRWSPVSPAVAAGWCRGRDVPERAVLLKDKRVACDTFYCWKYLLKQQDIVVILAVHLHPRVDKYLFSHSHFWHGNGHHNRPAECWARA